MPLLLHTGQVDAAALVIGVGVCWLQQPVLTAAGSAAHLPCKTGQAVAATGGYPLRHEVLIGRRLIRLRQGAALS